METALQNYLQKIVPSISAKSASAVLALAAEGGTVPFIARYRKEKTGNLDEVQIRAVISANEDYHEITKRKAFLLKEIHEQGNLTELISKRIETSWDLNELEEIYRPFKKKKKTKATIARDAGIGPLADWLWEVGHGTLTDSVTMEVKAKDYLNIPAGFASYEIVLKGAQDILVEKIANEPEMRAKVRKSYSEAGYVVSKRTKSFKPNSKFEMYQDFKESVKSLLEKRSSHRYLAMRRGWEEEELSVDILANDEQLLKMYEGFSTNRPDNAIGIFLRECAKQGLQIYVVPSVVNEIHKLLKEKADTDAIQVFSENVRKLLLASPFGAKVVLGVDPGLKTGCKLALVDKGGNFITHTVMQILGDKAEENAIKLFGETVKNIAIEAIAVGNGTAGRETEVFIRKVLKTIGKEIPVIMVNESGASVYSASDLARQEFPELDITVKGAISIARRLQDSLSELVKVDPKSIGVGQYQHDVNQNNLKKSLEGVVESCVNNVGVDLNTASESLLAYVSGIGPALAKNIVEQRKAHLFSDRNELLKVPKFSTKAFEQSAGFLRISTGKVFLDKTGIHPERYLAIREMAQEVGANISELVGEGAKKLLPLRPKWLSIIGEYTFDDIVKELEKPGRDPRDPFKIFQFREDIFAVKDLKEEMICPGIVTNVTNFGAFVDIGVHQDGLVHISELSHKFIEDPKSVVSPGDQVSVRVLNVDLNKNQIALSMKLEAAPERAARTERPPRQHENRNEGDRSRPREQKPRDDRNQRQQFDKRPQTDGQGNRQGQRPGQRPGGHRPPDQKPMGKPFNNPFAALQGINKK